MSARSPRKRLRQAYWQLRQWFGVMRDVLPRSGTRPVRTAELGVWLDQAHALPLGDLAGRKILAFSYTPWWTDFMAATSAVLVGRGADVTFAWLPWAVLDRETPDLDERLVARYTRPLSKPRPRFRGINLTTIAAEPAPVSESLIEMVRTDVQYIRRREEVDIEGADRDLFQFRMDRMRRAQGAFAHLLREGRFDSVLLPSGGVLEFAAVWQAAHDAGIVNVTVESWERVDTCGVAWGRPVYREIAKESWASDSHQLDPARRARVENSMREREGAGWTGHVISYQTAAIKPPDELRAQLGLDDKRPIALMCPNVPYDAVFLGLKTEFASMADWFRTVLREFGQRPDWQVIVRSHPGEAVLDSRQSAQSIFSEVFPQPPENVHFVAPADPVNTYACMRIADIGLVFGSTTGMELAARGLHVVMPVQTHYSGKGFTQDAFTLDGYMAALRQQLDHPRRLTQAEIDLAWCYIDVYMNRWPRAFPWCLGSFPSDIRRWPIERVLGDEGMRRFGDTFTILGGGARAQELLAMPSIIPR